MNAFSVREGEARKKARPGYTPPGLKAKDLVGIPWRVAFALQADGWWLRQDIIWHKPNPMPESVRDRCTKAHEYVFLLTKSERYFYDAEAVSEAALTAGESRVTVDHGGGGYQAAGMNRKPSGNQVPGTVVFRGDTRNRRSVWTVATKPYKGAHFATMPPGLVAPCIKAGTSEEGCCPSCLSPLERVVEKSRLATRPGLDTKVGKHHEAAPPAGWNHLHVGNRDPQRHVTQTTTTGWRAGCQCYAGKSVPCVVLDPFAGSGTTLAVAAELGRSGIGCELNPEYVKLACERIESARGLAPLFS
jgi:hypothetical protein